MIADERHPEPRTAIDYIPRYSDRIEEESEEDLQEDSQRAIEEGNRRLNNALPGPLRSDSQPSVENEWARS
jgi:hypothetical protein